MKETNTMLIFKINQINKMAIENNWLPTYQKEEKGLIAFTRNGCHLEIYCRSMRVLTCMPHNGCPKILERTNIGLITLNVIFINPRAHTGKGKIIE